jgi:hypothetical protein
MGPPPNSITRDNRIYRDDGGDHSIRGLASLPARLLARSGLDRNGKLPYER